MTRLVRFAPLAFACSLLATPLHAQAPASSQSTTSEADATLPAFTTSEGDTGLWFVPTAEVLARGKWSASGYRVSLNYIPGFTNVADFPLTFGIGVAKHVEVFGALKAVTRIDRDIRPLFTTSTEAGGPVGTYPYVRDYWSGNKLGDFTIGAKVNLLSEEMQKPMALAVRGTLKLPTGDKDSGASTGKTDGFLDLVVSKDLHGFAELAGYAGGAFRSSPSDVSASKGIRWGFGGGFPSRGPLRFTAEMNGEKVNDNTVTVSAPLVAIDGSQAFGTYENHNIVNGTIGLTFQLPNGFFAGIGVTKSIRTQSRNGFRADSDPSADYTDAQVRIGFHPGVRRFVPPPPPAPVAAPRELPPAPAAAPNRPPTFGQNGVTANPSEIAPGQSSTLTANAQDADGDSLTYRWTAPVGTFTNPTARVTEFRPPENFEGPITVTVTADDGKGGVTSASTTIMVRRPTPPVVELSFEDVYFDFDRSSLRPDAQRLLDGAVTALRADTTKNLVIEGHTCNIGTAEYNLALGERRAKSVYDYLIAHGVPATRLETRSFGEEQPKYDNSREETRRLNRRAALVVKVQ